MRLPNNIIDAVKKAGVQVYFAPRSTTKLWNSTKLPDDPVQFGGWYWMRSRKGIVTNTDDDGPFRSESAAIRDAFVKLQIRTLS